MWVKVKTATGFASSSSCVQIQRTYKLVVIHSKLKPNFVSCVQSLTVQTQTQNMMSSEHIPNPVRQHRPSPWLEVSLPLLTTCMPSKLSVRGTNQNPRNLVSVWFACFGFKFKWKPLYLWQYLFWYATKANWIVPDIVIGTNYVTDEKVLNNRMYFYNSCLEYSWLIASSVNVIQCCVSNLKT